MDNVKIRQTILVSVAALVLMLLLFFLLLWKPQMARLDELNKQISQEEGNLQTAKNTLARLREVKKKAASAEVELAKLTKMMPADPKLPELIEQVQDMANDAGVTFVMIRPSEPNTATGTSDPAMSNPTESAGYNEMPIDISMRGSYVAILDFLRRVEKSPRALKVAEVKVRLKDYPDLDLDMKISAFTMEGSGQAVPPSQKNASIKY